MNLKKNRIMDISVYLIMAAIFVLATYPYLQSGYYGDDILNSSIRGEMKLLDMNLLEIIIKHITDFIKMGRWFPVVILQQDLIFYFFQDLIVYKIVLLVLSFLTMIYFTKFISYYYSDRSMAAIAGIFMVLCFPYYVPGSNSMSMYVGLMQVQVLLILQSVLFALNLFKTNNRKNKILAYGIYIIALLHYETSYLLFPVIFLLAYKNIGKFWNTIKQIKIYIFITFIGFVLNMGIRFYSSINITQIAYDGIQLQFSFWQMIQTFAVQFFGALPMVSVYNSKISAIAWDSVITTIEIPEIILLSLFIAAVVWFLGKQSKTTYDVITPNTQKKSAYLALASIIIWIGSAVLISLSKKYQVELLQSKAPHIPVYMEFFFGFIFIMAIFHLSSKLLKLKKIWVNCLLVIGIFLSTICFQINREYVHGSVDQERIIYQEMRTIYEEALQQGLAEQVEKNAIILIDISYAPVIYPVLFYEYVNPDIEIYRMDQYINKMVDEQEKGELRIVSDNQPIYITKCFVMDGQKVVYLDAVESIVLRKETKQVKSIVTKELMVYRVSEDLRNQETIDQLPIVNNNEWTLLEIEQGEFQNELLWKSEHGHYDYVSYAFWQ